MQSGWSVGSLAGAGFVGRRQELSRLSETWDTARRSSARIVGVAGPPGIGKTALVRGFLELADPAALLWVSGDEDATALPWGVLSQIVSAMPASRAATAVVAEAGHAAPAFVGQALARDLQEANELVLVVDDAHWGDRLSMAALRVAVRRLVADPVMVVMIHQPPRSVDLTVRMRPPANLGDAWRRVFESDRGVQITMAGLPANDLMLLAAACGHPGLSPTGANRLHEHTGGHPLHVRHLLDQLPMRAIGFGKGVLPAPREPAAAAASRLASCRSATRDLLGAGAVLGRRFRLATARQIADGVGADAAAEAVEAGLVEEVPGSAGHELAFTSTLVRALVYHDLGRDRRRDLHRRAAGYAGAGAIWHRIAAADGPDDELAELIEQEAGTYLGRGQIPLAAAYLRHALDLTPPGPARTPRLLTAVEAALLAGDTGATVDYQGELTAADLGAWSDYVCGFQLLVTGQFAEAQARLGRALAALPPDGAPASPPQPPDLAARIQTQLAVIGVLRLAYPDMVAHGAAAVAAAQAPWVVSFAWFARALGLAVAGRSSEALADLSDADSPGASAGLDGLVARGVIRLWTDDLAGARQDLTTVARRAGQGETLRIGQALGFLGEVEYRRGSLGEAVLLAEAALGDATENHRFWDYALLHSLVCYPLAAQAAWEQAESHAAQATTWARRVGAPAWLAYAAASHAAIAQARGDAAGLLAAADELEAIYPARESGTHLAGPLRADALAQLGRDAEATDALADFLARLSSGDRLSTRIAIARVRAQIAVAAGRPGEALPECDEAIQLALAAGLPLEVARIRLLTGICQSAMGRRAAAGRSFREALCQFTSLGAMAYVTQALRASEQAGFSLPAPPVGLDSLTPAEWAVVTLVCQGLSNQEIAERLVLSVRTIESHLTNVFRRLDVASRSDLRKLVTGPG